MSERRNYTGAELFRILNETDECSWIEAKESVQCGPSVLETICAYANTVGLGSGYLLLGVCEGDVADDGKYRIVGVPDCDSFQRDLASACATTFNHRIRPDVRVECLAGKTVLVVRVDELPGEQKPLYFLKEKLPKGARIRVGGTDQCCSEDDLSSFYHLRGVSRYDRIPVPEATLDEVDPDAVKRYRALRGKIRPDAEELTYDDEGLLRALGCVADAPAKTLTLAGLMLFGNSRAQRLVLPMTRIDYIRVQGNKWMEDPDNRFTTIDMRGPLLLLIYRLLDAIGADLPMGFLLPEKSVQAVPVGLPARALREALVNAMMHRSYREDRPTQVIRYDNRLEIINPGYSLKPDDLLGEPGSETRNPSIAEVFHETGLAETKGSGIRAMRRLMEASHLSPPTFESDREANTFTSRLFLQNFLSPETLTWLANFAGNVLSDSQKKALVFVREVGVIDNPTYRQMSGCDTLMASHELRELCKVNLLQLCGKGRSSFYQPGSALLGVVTTPPQGVTTPPQGLNTLPHYGLNALPSGSQNCASGVNVLPDALNRRLRGLRAREQDRQIIEGLILDLCAVKPMTLAELAGYLKRNGSYLKHLFVGPLLKAHRLGLLHPEMVHHPRQAYLTLRVSD